MYTLEFLHLSPLYVCRPTSFPGSDSQATSVTVMDPPDVLLYLAKACLR